MLSLNAMAQFQGQVRQTLTQPINAIEVTEGQVNIIYDTADYVLVKQGFTTFNNQGGDITVNGTTLSIANPIANNMEVHLSLRDGTLSLKTEDLAKIRLTSCLGDTLVLNTFAATADDISRIEVVPFLQCESISMATNDMGKIAHHSYSCTDEALASHDLSEINNLSQRPSTKADVGNNASPALQKGKQSKPHYSFSERSHLSLLLAWNNWGSTPLNGLMTLDGAAEALTKLLNYQYEWSYDIVCRRHFSTAFGIGIEGNFYDFANPFVGLDDNKQLTIMTGEGYDNYNWQSKFKTTYVYFPIRLAYNQSAKHNKLQIYLTALPGFAIYNQYTGLIQESERNQNGTRTTERRVTTMANSINPFKCDARLTFGYDGLFFFLQTALVPQFKGTPLATGNTNAYPFKIGFGFEL